MIRRHSLVWLRDANDLTEDARAWHGMGHPFVVCRQRPNEELSLGFCRPNPERPDRIAAASRHSNILHSSRPPELSTLPLPLTFPLPPLPPFPIRMIGSRMWQALTNLNFVRSDSDLDLVIDLESPAQANDAITFLNDLRSLTTLRIDAELSFPNQGEIHWEEWKSGCQQVLLKSITQVRLCLRGSLSE